MNSYIPIASACICLHNYHYGFYIPIATPEALFNDAQIIFQKYT